MLREIKLKLLRSPADYPGAKHVSDPMKFYYRPFFGGLYRRRVEMCLAELAGGENILEVGFGSGLTFLNLAESYKAIWGLDLESDCERVQKHFAGMGINCHLSNGSVLKMPYPDNFFDSVLLISILEHLKPAEQDAAFMEIKRVLKPGGHVVYGIPVERPLMVLAFKILGYNIREHHFSTETDARNAAGRHLKRGQIRSLCGFGGLLGSIYEVGVFEKGLAVPVSDA